MEYNYKKIKVNYLDFGDGEPIVLLHGWGQNIGMMLPVANAFNNNRCIILDFPGFGKSESPKEIWGVDDYVELLNALFEELGIINPVIIGHSFGCRVAIKFSCKYHVKKMIFTGAAGIRPKRSLNYYARVYTFKALKNLFKLPGLNKYQRSLYDFFGSSDYKQTSGVMRGTFQNVVNEDLTKYLPSILCPVLLLWGKDDDATPLSDGYKMEGLINDCALIELSGTHYAYLENIKYFNTVAKEFINNG